MLPPVRRQRMRQACMGVSIGKAEEDGLEFRLSGAGLKDRAAYGFMALQFLRRSSKSINSTREQPHAANL